MKVYITKYTLTQGIYEIEARKTQNPNLIVDVNSSLSMYHGEGKEWHLNKENALKKAEEMRIKQIKSLKSKIEKLEKMEFK